MEFFSLSSLRIPRKPNHQSRCSRFKDNLVVWKVFLDTFYGDFTLLKMISLLNLTIFAMLLNQELIRYL